MKRSGWITFALAGTLLTLAPGCTPATQTKQRTEVMLYEAPRQVSKLPVLYLGPSAAKSPSELSRHARFPQGLPPGFDRGTALEP